MTAPPPDLWTFATRTYAGAGDACLALQDGYGVDVPLLLFAAWIGETRGVALSPDAVAEADGWIRDWRREVVQPLRAVRRRLKDAGAETLRQTVKAAELESERVALTILEDLSVGWTGAAIDAAPANLDAVFAFATRHGPEAASRGLLSAVAEAARAKEPA
jgi:uncharacterized protein (TIGR02444 family)